MQFSLPPPLLAKLPTGLATWRPNLNLALRGVALLAAILLCWQLAGVLAQLINWQSRPPALVLPAPLTTDRGDSRNPLIRWFAHDEAAKATTPTDGLQLIAVIAGTHGVALLGGIEATPVAAQVGQEIRAGLRLAEVHADHVVFEQAGARSELAFPKGNEQTLISDQGSAPPAVTPVTANSAPVAGGSAPAQNATLSRGQLAGVAQGGNLGNWDKGLATFADGGIRVTAASEQPLAKLLNLRDGDILKRINDRDLNQIADVSLIYHHFSQSQDVTLSILRDGKPQQLHFDIQP